MSSTTELLYNNTHYVASFDKRYLPAHPAKKVAILTCMDARLDPAKALGLQEGDAHVIRNAGGVATEDAIRSLVLSQRLFGTEEIILVHHTKCGMETFRDDAVKDQESWPIRASARASRSRRSSGPKTTSSRPRRASGPTPSCPGRQSVRLCTTWTRARCRRFPCRHSPRRFQCPERGCRHRGSADQVTPRPPDGCPEALSPPGCASCRAGETRRAQRR